MTEKTQPLPHKAASADVLTVQNLRTYYHKDGAFVRAVDGVSLRVPRNGSLGIAGESGSGKTQTALSIVGLLDDAPGIVGGAVWVDGVNVLDGLDELCTRNEDGGRLTITKDLRQWHTLHERRLRAVRGKKISMVFQEPKSSLIPYLTVGAHLRETLAALSGKEASDHYEAHATDLLQRLEFQDPSRVLGCYPYELSGGESQRVMLGLALLGRPQLLIADEPTTQLDTVLQRRVLDMLAALVAEMKTALLLITHDLAVMRLMVDQVVIMFAGKILEAGPVASVINPANEQGHPYTQQLLQAASRTDYSATARQAVASSSLKTQVNTQGCRYYYRCGLKDVLPEAARKRCLHEEPPAVVVETNHTVACWARQNASHE